MSLVKCGSAAESMGNARILSVSQEITGGNSIQSPFRSWGGLLWLIVIITLADLTVLISYFLFEDSVFIISMEVPLDVSTI